VKGLRQSVGFLTVIGRSSKPSPAAIVWFPLVGAGLGALVGLTWWGAAKWWPLGVAAALAVVVDLALTGLLHFDGLVDCADALLAPMDRPRRLDVLRDPHVGAFGLAAGAGSLGMRWVALATIRPSLLVPVGLWCASRTVMGLIVLTVPYARAQEGGLASAFLGARRWTAWWVGVVGLAGSAAALIAWRPLGGAVSLGAGVLCAGGLVWLAARRLAGFTGDVVGGAGFLLESVGLVVAAAKW
jgi:adenosylcobinamide-GDP ribazoletransferase